jgi:predicted ATPase/DNA-binding SARP family transcriptional activator
MVAVPARDDLPTTIDVRLLGPVELTGHDRPIPLGGRRLRTLFGLLALRAPATVSREALIDGVWDSAPPANAAKTLRAHIAYLRRGLAGAGVGALIATRAPGYALDVPSVCVDAHRFEDRVRQGREASAAGAIAASAAHLRSALRLWRGDVLADCSAGEWARAEAIRLHEVRLYATEELLAAELALGDHARVAAELESLVSRHPLRERLWELLMRALFQAGRRADALRAYRRARARLVHELGVEPGPAMRRLEAAILAGDTDDTGGTGDTRRAEPPRGGVDPADPGEPAMPAIPVPLTTLIGRSAEVAELIGLLGERRLVTLTGVGGCGKTRLAIAVATGIAASDPDSVRFLDLSPVAHQNFVVGAVAAALGVPGDPAAGPVEAIVRHLRPQRCLLVLDNCEHLVPACARLVEMLLRACPALRVLATTREALGVPGEVAFPVPPLPAPRAAPTGGLAEVQRYDAVRLLLDRATAATVRDLTDADAPALATVCAGLDGLPLAIELAAARTSVLTVAEIAGRLHDPDLLHANRYPVRPHHRALDATIGWSYDLLDPAARSKFRRLAVFVGGFTLAAAEALWSGRGDRPPVDVLADLVAKSLVVMERRPTGARFRLLETIRRWAADRLAECRQEEHEARRRHAVHYLALAEEGDRCLRGATVGEWLERLGADHENLRAALAWTAEHALDPATEVRFATALARYCRLRGRYSEGRRWLEDALGREPVAPAELLGRAFAATARFAFLLGDYREAEAWAESALEQHRACADHDNTARTLRLLASVARERGGYRRSLARLGAALETPGLDCAAVAAVFQLAGYTAWLAGAPVRAERLLREALHRYQRLADPENVASTSIHLATAAFYRGRLIRARCLAEEAHARLTELDVKEGVGRALHLLGLLDLRQGRPARAVVPLRASLELHRAAGDRWRQASVIEALAAAFLAAGEPVRAAELIGLAVAMRRALGVPVPEAEREAWEATRAGAFTLLPEEEWHAALARGAKARVPDLHRS